MERPFWERATRSGHFDRSSECLLLADIVAKVFLHWESKILRAAGAAFV